MTADPLAALRRIAYLLERDRAETYKVQAFRKAASAIAEVSPEKLAAMSRRELTAIPHVGDTSASVIAESLAGKTPSYLAKLEEEPAPSMSPAAAALRQSLQGDCHGHSEWSDGGSPIREMAETARALGHKYWTLTDHSPRLTIAHGLDAERLREQLDVVAELNAELAPFRILTGIEVDILEDGTLDQDDELLARLDVVVASVHSKLRMDAPSMTKRMIRAVESPNVDVLGHCTGRIIVGRGRPPSTFDAEQVFEACASTGTAVEINSRPERLDPPEELLDLAISLGCLVTIDTDAHAPGQLEWQYFGCEKAAAANIAPARVMNALGVEKLLAWTASHGR
jgi:putative hydrolase